MEAPKTIFIDSNYSQEIDGMYSQGLNKDTDIEYIRKDIYDKAIEALKMCLRTRDPFELMTEIEDTLKELGEVD